MKVEFFTVGSVSDIVKRIQKIMEETGFIFSENDASYSVRYSNGKILKSQTGSKFWARKQLEAPHPAHFSIEIDGEVVIEKENSVVKAIFIENHANRPHDYGGSSVIDEYVDIFSKILINE